MMFDTILINFDKIYIQGYYIDYIVPWISGHVSDLLPHLPGEGR